MNWRTVATVARAEARSVRRLVRYWIFAILASLLAIVGYLYYALLHGFFSSYSGSVGPTNSEYVLTQIGWGYLLVFTVGLILMGFDVRERDRRERMVEVLDTRPYSNPELVAGRFLGILIPSWMPLLLVAGLFVAIGWAAEAFSWPFGEPPLLGYLAALVFPLAIPAFAFFLAWTFLVSLLVRSRLLTACIGLATVGLVTWLGFLIPLHTLRLVDVFGIFSMEVPSAIVGPVLTWASLAQRLGVLVAAFGLLGMAAAVHPRLDGGSRPRRGLIGGGVAAAGVLLYLAGIADGPLGQQQFEAWAAAHEARRDEPVAELRSVTGDVVIRPGRTLTVDVELALRAPGGGPALETLLFTLNPGLEVSAVADASGGALAFEHRHGLLDVRLPEPLAPGQTRRIGVRAEGAPQTFFGYLDTAAYWATETAMDAQVVILGVETGIFHPGYVGLMPGLRWLPTPGAEVGRGDPLRRPADFFTVDLVVDVPEGWLTAGPGRRRDAPGAEAGRARFRYAPEAPLPQVALLAAPFERRAAEVRGVELEVLLHPTHTENFEVLADAGDEIRRRAEELLDGAAELGLDYPYGAFTLVEVPSRLRGYEGGWRLDSALAQPAMALLPEMGFPTANFATRFRDPGAFEDREGGLPRAKVEAVEGFFEADVSGGNLFAAVGRSFFEFQTAARGPEGVALNHVLGDLALRLLTDREAFFSAHLYDRRINALIGEAVATYMTQRGDGATVGEAVIEAAIDRAEVWEQATTTVMTEMDPWQDPGLAVNVVALRGRALARSLLDGLGRADAGRLLAELRARHAGGTFTEEQLLDAAASLGLDLETLLGDWLDEAGLPGFVVSEVRHFRLPDGEGGTPRYQVVLDVRNPELAPGLARLRYRIPQGDGDGRWEHGAPVRVPAGESLRLGLVTARPIDRLEIDPYLSLNRGPFEVSLSPPDENVVDEEPVRGAAPSDWRPDDDAGVVVDDLDPGFRIESGDASQGLRLGGAQGGEFLDQGLPVHAFGPPPPRWSRIESHSAWGTYRHTAAAVRSGGDAGSRAVFETRLERSGPWRLALHLPAARGGFGGWNRGRYSLAVVDASGRRELSFDASAVEGAGWSEVGEVEIAAGDVRVELSSESDGSAVIADAVRWEPRAGSAAAATPEPGESR